MGGEHIAQKQVDEKNQFSIKQKFGINNKLNFQMERKSSQPRTR